MSDLNLENQNTAERQTELIATGHFPDGVVLQVKPGANTVGDFDGIQGIGGGIGKGVRGDSNAAAGLAFGVFGIAISPAGAGVSGRNDTPGGAGVSGFSIGGNAFNGTSVTNDGVVGISNSAGKSGVLGLNSTASHQSFSFGVFGGSSEGIGVGGRTDNFIGVHGVCVNRGVAVKGDNEQIGAGVEGTAVNGPGVIGKSDSSAGATGFSTNFVGVLGWTANPASWAGAFLGDLLVTGAIVAGTKDAIVPFPDGTQRVLHCMESPEHWFEDFGSARLKRGRATVKLYADFAKVIRLNEYRVFLTPEGDCQGLYVRKRGNSFDVRELQGGTSSVAFSYRIVGKRKDIKGHKRFAKIDPRLQMPVPRARMARRTKIPQPPPTGLHAFAARMEKEAGMQMPKRGRKRQGSP